MADKINSFSRQDWNAYARCYDTLTQLRPYQALVGLVSGLVPISAKSVLDAGCGTGTLLQAVASRMEALLCGVDASPEMLAIARAKLADYKITLNQGDLETVGSWDGQYDCIVSTNVLYTLNDPLAFLRRVRQSLSPLGSLVVATPKAGYDNGLILKAHCGDDRDDDFWRDPHQSIDRENMLLQEAFGDSSLADDMKLIAAYNRVIYQTRSFHFFTEAELLALMQAAGLQTTLMTTSYANQCWLVVATRSDAHD